MTSAGSSLVEIGLGNIWSEVDALNDLTFKPDVPKQSQEVSPAIEVSPALLAVEGLRAANASFVENSTAKRERQKRLADHLNKEAINTRIDITNNNQETESLIQQMLKAENALNAATASESAARLKKERAEKVWQGRLERYKAMIKGLGAHLEAGLEVDIEVDTDITVIENAIASLIEEAEVLVTTDTDGQSKLRDSLQLVLDAKKRHVTAAQQHERAVNNLRLSKIDYEQKLEAVQQKSSTLAKNGKSAVSETKKLEKHGRHVGFETESRTMRERLLGRFSLGSELTMESK